MKSESESPSLSESDVYQDVHVCCNDQDVCSTCKENVIHTDKEVDISNRYEIAVKNFLIQLARSDKDVLNPLAEDDAEQEPLSHYYHGGYHVLRLGEFLDQMKYFIIRKLGWDELSTQWLARDVDKKRYVTVTIYKSSEMHTLYAKNLINVYTKLQEHPHERIMQVLDHFEVTGVNGTHVCIVTEIMAECLCNYMIRQKFQPTPLAGVKIIVKQLLEGLHHLHVNNKQIHTSIKPESVFFKADKMYVMALVFEAYMGFYKSTLPRSFTCNLPGRLEHMRTNTVHIFHHIQTKMLLLDPELEQFVAMLEGNEHESHEQTNLSKIPDSTNNLIKRLSRYIKSKINLQQSASQNIKRIPMKKKSKSFSLSGSSKESKYKSSNTTNYGSPSTTSSSNSKNSRISSSDPGRFENKDSSSDKKIKINDFGKIQNKVNEICCIANSDQLLTSFVKLMNDFEKEIKSNNANDSSDQEGNENIFESIEHLHTSEITKTDEIQSEIITDNEITKSQCDIGDNCFESCFSSNDNSDVPKSAVRCTNDNQIESLENENLETSIGKIEEECQQITINKEEIHEKLRSDSWDDIKTSPEDSGKEESASCKSRCESNVEDSCRCHHCRNDHSSSDNRDGTTSQGDSSYSTSTSTQESYSEFLLSYCKHNTLCTTYTRYVKQITQYGYINEDLMSPIKNIQIVITDLENARPENDETICREDIHRQYKAIELIYTKQFDSKIDIWSTACLTFELITGDYLFNPFESKFYTIDEHHILKIIQLMSEIPPNLMENERCIRNIKTLLERDQKNITSTTAKENFYRILAKSYKIPKDEAKQLVRFLIPMLSICASKRASAKECLQSEWFST